MLATSKSSYKKHRYSGPRKSRKRVHAQLKRNNGDKVSRVDVWRKKRKIEIPQNESADSAGRGNERKGQEEMPRPEVGARRGGLDTPKADGPPKIGRMSRAPIQECCVLGCGNNEREHPGKVFYVFPDCPKRQSEWLERISRLDLSDKLSGAYGDPRVCSDHFASAHYTPRGALRPDALPALSLPGTGKAIGPEELTQVIQEETLEIQIHEVRPLASKATPNPAPDAPNLVPLRAKSELPEDTMGAQFHDELPHTIIDAPECPTRLGEVTLVKTEPDDAMDIQFYEEQPPTFENPPDPISNFEFQPIRLAEVTQLKTELPDAMDIEFYEEQPLPQGFEVEPIDVEIQCQERDPLAIVKSESPEPDGRVSVATQTFSRKELYLIKASRTEFEQIDLPAPPAVHWQPFKRPVLVQTTASLLSYYTLPVKKQLEAKIRGVNKKIKTIETAQKKKIDKYTFLECCEKYLDPKIVYIVQSHWHLQEKSKGNRYGEHLKHYALNLYLSNPQSYRFVEQIFNLPSKTTIARQQSPASSGTNLNLIEKLKSKVDSMTENEKVCAMCFDVMRVNRNLWYEVHNDFLCGMQEIDQVSGPDPAEFAVVLMVRGLFTKWTQPVSFALVTENRRYPELKEWLHKIIGLMFDIGLNIKAFVCDLETEFIDVFVRPETHYFEIDGRRIYQYYDVRYLFRSVRNEFMQYNFHVGDKVAQWSHILKVYDKDKNHELSLMPKITKQHVRPTGESLNDTDLAIQVFNTAVAAALNFYVVAKMAPQKTTDTVEFIVKMSKLYDIFTSNKLSNAYRGTAEQNHVLLDILGYLQGLEVRDKHGEAMDGRSVVGMMVNIRSILSLLEDLKMENIHHLCTKILSKDCLELFFDECRRLGGNCCERPTPIMFARSFRRFFLESLKYNVIDGEYEQDLKSTLTQIGEHVQADTGTKQEPEFDQRKMLAGVSDYKLIQWPSTEYIAGYLLWKCLKTHKCSELIENLSNQYDLPAEENAAMLLLNFQQYNADNVDSENLPKPPQTFIDFVDRMDEKYYEYYTSPDRKSVNFGLSVYRCMEQDTFEMPCECFPLKFMKTLFIRLKIEFCVKDHNRNRKYQRLPRTQGKKQKKK